MRRKYTLNTRFRNEIDDAVLTMTEKDAARIEWPMNRSWAAVFWWFSAAVLLIFAGRILFLSAVKGDYYRQLAHRNSIRSLSAPAPRGVIYDRFGSALVRNIPSVDVIAVPADLPVDPDAKANELRALKEIFRFTESEQRELEGKVSGRSVSPVVIRERITQEETLLFSERSRDFPGISLFKSATRSYADSLIFSHIIGYEGKIRREELDLHPEYALTDSIGKQGIEKSYEAQLRGTPGVSRFEVDALGKVRRELGTADPVPGSDLILHIDADLQKKIFDTLQSQLETGGLSKGAALALDPRNGAVLALVSYPSFDNNLFSGGISSADYKKLIEDPAKPLFNRALSGEYPPGSTIKPVLAAAALSEGVVSERTSIESRGGIRIGEAFFGDWKPAGHGTVDIKKALAESVNTFFYAVGGGYGSISGMGMAIMKKYEKLFGLGEATGIDTTGEASGFLPDENWKREKFGDRWRIGDDYNASIGQGFVLATPLQMVNAVAAIANGGTLYEPHIVSQVRFANGETRVVSPKAIREGFVSEDVLRIVREGMRLTVTDGTAQSLKTLPVAVAGKTGTAQFGNEQKTQGWFESFAPYEDPQIALIVLTEGQEEHGYNAVPITKEILQWYFNRNAR